MPARNIKKVSVTLGLKYDGAVPMQHTNTLGHLTTGPNGFLRLLETQLGIPDEQQSFTNRLIQYLACLEACNRPDRFYHASYQADPFSVARTLLQWRDQWYLAGWKGEFDSGVPARLADMAEVEKFARIEVAGNLGQRIHHVMDLLADHVIAIESIDLHDALEHFPPLWQKLIEATGAPVSTSPPLTAQAPADCDLGQLQRRLLKSSTEKLELSGDGSFIIIDAGTARESTPLIAHAARQWLENGQGSLALLSEHRGAQLDEALEAAGACRLGFTDNSPWRPVFQVLPLALELLWAPLNATALFQFLSHPVGPIPSRIREKLSATVARTPGIGSEIWQSALESCLEAEEEPKRELYRETIQYWLQPDRFDPKTGIECAVLSERARRVSDWLMGLRESADESAFYSLYAVALNQVTEFISAVDRLKEHGRDPLTQDNVRRLIQDVRGTGSPLIDRNAEVIPGLPIALRADHAGSFHEPVDQMVWWDCQASDSVRRLPWNRAEQMALTASGVQLQSENDQLAWLGEAWTRPILAAKGRCILVLHQDTDRHHPIWDQITTHTVNIPSYRLGDPDLTKALQTGVAPLSTTKLPGKARWWQLPEGLGIPKRDRESYSSLDAFIYSPYQWLLKYAARIRPGSLTTLAEGNLLKGNVAHRLFEQFFNEHAQIPAIQHAAVPDWVDNHIYSLLEAEGATLLEPGQQADCERFVAQMKDALITLAQHLQDAAVVKVETELQQNGLFTGGELTGYIDLLATRADGSEVVVDIKWGGLKYRRESLKSNNYLQLATYAQFRYASAGKSLPALGYYIIRDAWMLNLNHDVFPTAESVKPENSESWGEFWKRFEHTWKWRKDQLERGLIEVTIGNTEPDAGSYPGETGLEIPEASDKFSDYAALTGWEHGA